MTDETAPRPPARDRRPSRTELLVDFVKSRLLSLAAIALVGVALLSGVGLSLPRWVRLGGLALVGAAPIGYIAFGPVRSLLPAPPMVWLVDVDLLDQPGAGLARIPRDSWSELTVTEGDLWNPAPSLYFGKNVNLEEMTAEGTWRGSLSDAEMLRALSLVKEVRGELEDKARRGHRIETQAFTIIRLATQENVKHVVETFEKGTLPEEGDAKDELIEDAISDFGLDQLATDGLDLDGEGDGLDGDHGDGLPEQAARDGADDRAQEVPADD